MSTNEIVTTIVSKFIEKLSEEKIDPKLVEKIKNTLSDNPKVTPAKLEAILYEESDEL